VEHDLAAVRSAQRPGLDQMDASELCCPGRHFGPQIIGRVIDDRLRLSAHPSMTESCEDGHRLHSEDRRGRARVTDGSPAELLEEGVRLGSARVQRIHKGRHPGFDHERVDGA
jgi:hypothetical protein